ncbi:MAG: class I tRNA ligase family protein, partial [Sphaerochaetaceae bacterium]
GVHHTNEIAQSEAATGKTWVNYWIHGEFLVNDTGKMSKSKGEFLTLQLLKEQGFDPMDYRYFCIGGHYRSQLQFSWEALQAAANGRKNLFEKIASLMKQASYAHNLSDQAKQYIEQFETFLGNDLNAPRGLAVLWSMLRDKTLSDSEKLACAFQMDRILGFNLAEIKPIVDEVSIPQNILELVSQRTEAKRNKNYKRADELRAIVEEAGYQIKDTPGETIVSRRCNQN